MKIKRILLISTLLVLLATACKKEGGWDGRSKAVTRQLQIKGLFSVYRITGTSHQINLNEGYGNSYIFMNFGSRTTIDFIPDSSQNLRLRFWNNPWEGYVLGDTQSLYLEYTFLHNLIIKVPLGPPQKLIIVKDRDDQNLPLAELAGEYEVEAGHTFNGRPGYVLRKFASYTNQGNGSGPLIMTIELAEVAK